MTSVDKLSIKKNHALNKYRGILVAVTLFLIFDLAVLVLNLYTSSSLNNDAVSINLAGRQRMLSQRTTKTLLTMQVDATQGQFNDKNISELKKVTSLFDETLNGFKSGGMVTGGDDKPIYLERVKDSAEIQSVDEALAIWQPYKKLLSPVLASKVVDALSLDAATVYARENNLKLLKLMNDLTTHLEKSTKAKASKLQLIQTVALVLSLLLFANIVFNAMRKLRAADRETEKAQRETTEILNTVKEGLFLLDPNLSVGSQFSTSMTKILQQPLTANMPFMPILEGLVAPDIYQSTQNYITLLFGNKVKENLVLSLNPLMQVPVQSKKDEVPRYLSFQFNRVVEDKQVIHLLVTVQDVTEQVTQSEELEKLRGQAGINLSFLEKLLQADAFQLQHFLHNAHRGLASLNELLAHADKRTENHEDLANQSMRIIHAIKGEAAAVGITAIEHQAHQFEENLVLLKKKEVWESQDILSLPVTLNTIMAQLAEVEAIVKVIYPHDGTKTAKNPPSLSANLCNNLTKLAEQVSNNQHKQVRLQLDLALLDEIDAQIVSKLEQLCIQLVRNGICHGIEASEARLAKGKPSQGVIAILAEADADNSICLSVRDDGQGIVPSRIRDAMLASGQYERAAVDAMTDKEIVKKLFEPGFSTANTTDQDAGRGIGMDMVQVLSNEMGAMMKLDTKPDVFTMFTFKIAQTTGFSMELNAPGSAV